jgi:hypothetical protein
VLILNYFQLKYLGSNIDKHYLSPWLQVTILCIGLYFVKGLKTMKRITVCLIVFFVSAILYGQANMEAREGPFKAQSNDIWEVIEAHNYAFENIIEIEKQYQEKWEEDQTEITQSYQRYFKELDESKPEFWETDEEFAERIDNERFSVQQDLNHDLSQAKEKLENERDKSLTLFNYLEKLAIENLNEIRTISEEDLIILTEEYERNERVWKLQIRSKDSRVSFNDLITSVDFNDDSTKKNNRDLDITEEIIDFHTALDSESLTSSVNWFVQFQGDGIYEIRIPSVSIINKVNGIEYWTEYSEPLIAVAYRIERIDTATTNISRISVVRDFIITNNLEFSPIDSEKLEVTAFPENVINNSYILELKDSKYAEIDDLGNITPKGKTGETKLIVSSMDGMFSKEFPLEFNYRIGDLGPAGGYIFFDAGNYARGWRFLEMAPEDIYDGLGDNEDISWGDTKKYDGLTRRTGTGIGSGKSNTEKIANYINSNKNAAQLCLNYEVNGYDDWFLPSKDELEYMVSFAKKHFGNYREILPLYSYWSSSVIGRSGFGNSTAWLLNVRPQRFEELEIFHTVGSIRAIREF